MKRLFTLAFASCMAASSFGQAGVWKGQSDKDMLGTYVESEDGNVLSFFCSKDGGGCAWGLSVNIDCDKGSEQPILGASQKGSAHLTLVCVGLSERKPLRAFYIKEYDQVINLVGNGGVIGLVIPLESGKFSVHRFNADGAMAAANRVAEGVSDAKAVKMKAETL